MSGTRLPLVYFSYRLAGSSDHARQLAQALRKQGLVEPFFDADIPVGSHWPSILQDALNRAVALVVFIDAAWLRYQDEWGRRRIDNPDDWVHRELAQALNRNIRFLPILVEDARMPPVQALPESLKGVSERQAARLRASTFESDLKPILRWVDQAISSSPVIPTSPQATAPFSTFRPSLEKLVISDFRCFENLELDFSPPSSLPGDWTCIVGLNGDGKTTILQAVALLMMGPDCARELGGDRLQAFRRGWPRERHQSVLRAWLRVGNEAQSLEMSLGEDGPRGNSSDPLFWKTWIPTAGYGAGRNLSDSNDRWDGASDRVLAQISLFDPFARLVRAEKLLKSGSELAQDLFANLICEVFGPEMLEVIASADSASPQFATRASIVRDHDLPDGFRSSAAWMANLCLRFSAIQPHASRLSELTGLVMIDEIDLHLHASLQRQIIPRLREALPNVQFIVTSHSPLIISSFDRHELILLDSSAPDNLRTLDRQILAFSSNEIYNWLMDTPPHSAALDKVLTDEHDPNVAAVALQSPDCNEEEAKAQIGRAHV